MEETILILFLRITIFLLFTDIQNVRLQTVPDPCPDFVPRTTIADMCSTDYAIEEYYNGYTTADSVALRVITQKGGCECEVSLQNQTRTDTLYMGKYELLTMAAPEVNACGLAIDIDQNIPNNLTETKNPIECAKGAKIRSITLYKDEVLHLRSRIIAGCFIRGYCIQIHIQHQPGDASRLQLHCSQYLTTTQGTHMTLSVSENVNVQIPVIIAAVLGWCLTALFALTTLCLYRRIKKQRANNSGEPNVNAQYQDLHVTRLSSCYSSLNASAINSEQHEHI